MKEETFILTDSQEALLPKMKAFLSGTDRIFRLTGKPGVGKTTITKIVLKALIQLDIDSGNTGSNIQVAGIALSHRAKNVLGQHIPNVFTFASAYGMKEKINDDGSRSFVFNKYNVDAPIGECSIPVFVHDEISQYTKEMMNIVLEKTPMFSKIILMGDKAQLPPIDNGRQMGIDADSPVFNIRLPEECEHELTERVRQEADNPILQLSDVIREEIFGYQNIERVLKEISTPKIFKNKGYSFITYSELNEHIKDKDHLNTCVIAFRNKTIKHFNEQIRNHLFDNPEENFIEKDVVCMHDTFYYKDQNDEIKYKLHNSEIFRIHKVFIKNLRYNTSKKRYKIPVHVASIVGKKQEQLIVPTKEGQILLDEYLNDIAEKCKIGHMRWDEFWNFKKKFCQCDYGYAMTAYKVQGSTYRTVYVDINDVLMTRPLTPKRKLQTIYTAITRAEKDVYFLKSRR